MRSKAVEEATHSANERPVRSHVERAIAPPRGLALARREAPHSAVDAQRRGFGNRVIARLLADEPQPEVLESVPAVSPVFATEHAGGLSVTLGAGETLSTIAMRHYGRQEAEWIRLLREANGISEREASRLRPGRGLVVPPALRPVDRKAPAVQPVTAEGAAVVPLGQVTFDAEGQEAPGASTHSRRPHVPSDSSGVTIGRGFDMGRRRAGQVRAQLEAAGVPRDTASVFAQAAGLTGDDARAFVRRNARLEVTPAQQWNLFVQEYQRIAGTTQLDLLRWELARAPEERVDPAGLDALTSELLVDLRFRGDLTSRTWSLLRPHLNDAAALGEIMRRRDNFPRVPRDRYERRCRALGVEPEAAPQVQRERAGPDALAGRPAPPLVRAALAGPAQPLEAELRGRMEARLGHDFGHVRVHTGPLADASARAVEALAYTVGEHVVFRERAFSPHTAEGQQVLAHELVHVTQQPPLAAGGSEDLVVGDPHSAEEREAQRLAPGSPGAAPTRRALQRQKAGEEPAGAAAAPAAPGLSLAEVLTRMGQFSGLPYAFSEADTVRELEAKIAALAKELQALPRPPASATPAEKAQHAERRQQIEASVAKAQQELQAARVSHADSRVIDVLRERHGPELAAELKDAVRQYGVVCNIFVELVMRTSGARDFPVTGQEYVPKTAKYRDVEAAINKQQKLARPGWGLEWAERMVDWAASEGAVLYDDTDERRKELPAEVAAGDIVIFRRPNGRYHVSMVIADGEGFNFIGARSSGKSSGKSLGTPFKRYDEQLSTRKGKAGLPQIMGQDKYMWILRPRFAATPPSAGPAPED